MGSLLEEFTGLTNTLRERQIDYAVCGGWAMAILGFPRATVDIDLLIPAENLEHVWSIAKDFGYDIEGTPLQFHDGKIEIRRISKVDEETHTLLTLDLLLVTEAIEEVWLNRQTLKWKHGTITSVSKDGLIQMKKISGRLQDLADIERLNDEG